MVPIAQEEEAKRAKFKKFLRRESSKLTHGQVSDAGNLADRFILSENGVLYYLGRRREFRE